jgi:hypothetical protein
MIKHLTPRSEEEIKEYFKNGIDDKELMELVSKGNPITNKNFKLRYSINLYNIYINNCYFELYEDACLIFTDSTITNCIVKSIS